MSTMTNEEAIKIIQGVRQYAYESGFMRDVEGFDFAIAALSAEAAPPAPTVTKERISRLIQINLGTVKSHADDLAESILAALQVSHD